MTQYCINLMLLFNALLLQIAFLSAVKFDCQIAAATYARVYFQLRESSPTAALRDLKPLRLEPSVARRLEQNAASLVRSASLDNLGQGRRAKTSQVRTQLFIFHAII